MKRNEILDFCFGLMNNLFSRSRMKYMQQWTFYHFLFSLSISPNKFNGFHSGSLVTANWYALAMILWFDKNPKRVRFHLDWKMSKPELHVTLTIIESKESDWISNAMKQKAFTRAKDSEFRWRNWWIKIEIILFKGYSTNSNKC